MGEHKLRDGYSKKRSKENTWNRKHRNKECLWWLITGLEIAEERSNDLKDMSTDTSQAER